MLTVQVKQSHMTKENPLRQSGVMLVLHFDMDVNPRFLTRFEPDPREIVHASFAKLRISQHRLQLLIEADGWLAPVDQRVQSGVKKLNEPFEVDGEHEFPWGIVLPGHALLRFIQFNRPPCRRQLFHSPSDNSRQGTKTPVHHAGGSLVNGW